MKTQSFINFFSVVLLLSFGITKASAQASGGVGKTIVSGAVVGVSGAAGFAVGGAIAGPVGAVVVGGVSGAYAGYVVEKYWPTQPSPNSGGATSCTANNGGNGNIRGTGKTYATRIRREQD